MTSTINEQQEGRSSTCEKEKNKLEIDLNNFKSAEPDMIRPPILEELTKVIAEPVSVEIPNDLKSSNIMLNQPLKNTCRREGTRRTEDSELQTGLSILIPANILEHGYLFCMSTRHRIRGNWLKLQEMRFKV